MTYQMSMPMIDLEKLTDGKVRLLTGMDRGEAARELFKLNELETEKSPIVVKAPSNLRSISTSFVQGLLAGAMITIGSESVASVYDFSMLPKPLQEDFERGIERLKLHY